MISAGTMNDVDRFAIGPMLADVALVDDQERNRESQIRDDRQRHDVDERTIENRFTTTEGVPPVTRAAKTPLLSL